MLKIEVHLEALGGYVNYEMPIIFSKIYLCITNWKPLLKVLEALKRLIDILQKHCYSAE